MSKSKVTVVIPTFNRREECKLAVEMVLAQSYQDFSLVVVVDGSTDGTALALDGFRSGLAKDVQDRFKILSQNNRGVSAARNTGIRSTATPLIALLDDDDYWPADKLEQQLLFLKKYPINEPVLCTTDFTCVQKQDESSRVMACAGCGDLSQQIKLGYFPPPSTWMFSRKAFESVGGFDEDIHAGEDMDFVMMLRKKNASIANLSCPIATYNDGGSEKEYQHQNESAARVLLKHGAWWRQVLSPEDLDKVLQWYETVLPAGTFSHIWSQCRSR